MSVRDDSIVRALAMVVIAGCGRIGFDDVRDQLQSASVACATGTACTITYPDPVRVGDLLRLDIIAAGDPAESVTDSAGNSWGFIARVMRPDNGVYLESYYAIGNASGTDMVTVAFPNPSPPKLSIYENDAPGVTPQSYVTATGSGNVADSGPLTVATPGLLAAVATLGPSMNPPMVTDVGLGWTLGETPSHGAGQSRLVTASGLYAATFDLAPVMNTPPSWAMIAVDYAYAPTAAN